VIFLNYRSLVSALPRIHTREFRSACGHTLPRADGILIFSPRGRSSRESFPDSKSPPRVAAEYVNSRFISMELPRLTARIATPYHRWRLSGVNSAGPQWDSNKFNGRARRRAGEARRPSLGEQVVGVVGEVRPDRPVYMAGEIRERLLPPSCGDARCRWDRRGTVCAPLRSFARALVRARARSQDGGSEG